MKILITGATGLLGSALLRLKPDEHEVYATYHTNELLPRVKDTSFRFMDIRDERIVEEVIDAISPDVIIHTAAKGSPDYCEKNKEDAWATNVVGTRNIIKSARSVSAHVIFTSTNQVFDGEHPPYSESSAVHPVNYYGQTKVQTEQDIGDHSDTVTIARLMTMYGWNNPNEGRNTAVWVLEMMEKKKHIKVVDDVFNNLLFVSQGAKILWHIATNSDKPKLVNIAGADAIDRYSFARLVAETFGYDPSFITPVPKSYFQDEAPRPLNTIYDTSFLESFYDHELLSPEQGLHEMKKEKESIDWVHLDNL